MLEMYARIRGPIPLARKLTRLVEQVVERPLSAGVIGLGGSNGRRDALAHAGVSGELFARRQPVDTVRSLSAMDAAP